MISEPLITIAALGPDSTELLTRSAFDAMKNASCLVLRTARHKAAELLDVEGIRYQTLDPLYEQTEDFDELCTLAADALIEKAKESGNLCYAVSEPTSDATVRRLAAVLPEHMALRVIPGVTLSEAAACAAVTRRVNTENLRTVTALSVGEIRVRADCPLAVTEIDSPYIASDVKLWATDLYDDEMTVYFIENAAGLYPEVRAIPLCELDMQAHYDHRTAVVLPPVSVYERARADFDDFTDIVRRLREPGGCPWDRAQTHHTLRRYMIEEACEAAEAMDGDDPMKIADELGDVLLQVVLNSRIAEEHGDFTVRDVTSMASRKMISRHEHVFGKAKAANAEEVTAVWENAKKRERGDETPLEKAEQVAVTLPALMRGQKVIKRLAASENLPRKKEQALDMLRQALLRAESEDAGEEELGALLESCCALAQTMDLDAETALRSSTDRRIGELRDKENKS